MLDNRYIKNFLKKLDKQIESSQTLAEIRKNYVGLYRPNYPEQGPIPIEPPNKDTKKKVFADLKNSLQQVATKEHKIITIYDYQITFVDNYILEFSQNNQPIPIIDIRFFSTDLVRETGLDLSEPSGKMKTLLDQKKELNRIMMQDYQKKGNKSILFPFKFSDSLTADLITKKLKENFDSLIKQNKKLEFNKKILGIIAFDNILGNTMIDPESEIKFLEALLDFSKEFTLIFADPRNTYGRQMPVSLHEKSKTIIEFRSEVTPYNTASYQTFDILRELLSKATIIETGRY